AGDDYAVRSGSTVLTITAERFARYDAGAHTISAQFQAETVEIAFELVKEAATPETSAIGVPMPIMIAVAVLLFGSAAAIPVVKTRRGRAAK
ncbi:MAG: hypothetical protein LBB57_03035, partial [Clostridiales Family XIII bacterium]|nr:hypothetical protein [Clostridiales Family XIII bacterium]